MEVIYWVPYYEQIASDLGLDRDADMMASNILSELLAVNGRLHPKEEVLVELERLIEGRDVYVLGAGPDLEMELDRLIGEKRVGGTWTGLSTGKDVLISADGATSALLARSLVPQIIVTDLDGGVEDQVQCLSRGSLMVVHAHGDNINVLKKVVPRLFGSVHGTTQVDPAAGGGLENYGGFTDGDRAAFLAQHFKARSITLLGFNFNEVAPKIGEGGLRSESLDPEENEFKWKKLAWANILLGLITNPTVKIYSGEELMRF
ncbi:MAG: DUF115 domain-containing protein [Candidatus Thermoplasmatota archaeon]|nr:DUF115 domain-containing protein [Candidatus Thermoplasmatota archaeon]